MAAIQIKDVPSDLHKKARLRARNLDLTLGDYVLSLIRRDMDRDKILTAPEAKEYGIIDQVLTSRVPLNK